jgi:AraC-like DNA-binding protein/ligand-binding sensor domain-containing protein
MNHNNFKKSSYLCNMKKKIFFLFMILIFMSWTSQKVQAQDFRVRTLPTQELLPSASIHCLMQDAEGYLWYGAERAGFCRDNGYQIDVFRPSDISGVAESNTISSMSETKEGKIFIGTIYGLFMLDKHNYQLNKTSITKDVINNLLVSRDGSVWIGTDKQFYQMDSLGQVKKTFVSKHKGKVVPVRSFYEDAQGNIYVLQWNGGILRKRPNEHTFAALEWTASTCPVQMVEDLQHHCYWVVTWDGVTKMQIDGQRCVLVPQPATLSHADNRGLRLLLDTTNGLLWTTTMNDLHVYRITSEGSLQEFPIAALSSGNKILDQIIQTRGGSIYVAGFTPHTFVFTPLRNPIVRMAIEGMQQATGYPVLADRSVKDGEHIWVWQGRVGLTCYDPSSNHLAIAGWKPSRCITKAKSLKSGLWASEKNQLYQARLQGGHIYKELSASLPEGQDICQIHDTGHGTLLLATSSVLYRMATGSLQITRMVALPSQPTAMAVNPNGEVYLVMDSKLYAYSQKLHQLNSEKLFTSLAADADGTLWAATGDGLVFHYLPETQEMQLLPYMRSRHDAPIRDIEVDGVGHLWIVTDQYVTEFNPKNLAFRSLAASDEEIGVSYFYGIEVNSADELTINGAGALCVLHSSEQLQRAGNAKLHPVVSSYSIDDKKYYVGQALQAINLNHDDIDLRLYMTTFNHSTASQTLFAYQLEGFNKEWVYNAVGDNTIYFSRLPKGTYRLLVKATDADGCWSEPHCVMTIISLPPWYETWWARLLFMGLAAALIFMVWKLESRIRLLHRLIARRQAVKLNEIELKREDIALNQRDDDFLRTAIAKVEENLSNTEYNVEALSSDMCMSRITFYRRLLEQTGQTPTDFIRDIRLKKAAQLLSVESHTTITDIARKVGFANPKYFAKCFREKFGVLPKDYYLKASRKKTE